jgi:hypothetical protein
VCIDERLGGNIVDRVFEERGDVAARAGVLRDWIAKAARDALHNRASSRGLYIRWAGAYDVPAAAEAANELA